MKMRKIDLLEFVPNEVKCGKKLREYPLNRKADEAYVMFSYITKQTTSKKSNSEREYSLTIPRYINPNQETFEVLGLLQAEMGKTDNGCISFCNHEYRLINKVLRWFEREIEIPSNQWRWYIKLNINEPTNKFYREEVENKVTTHWLKNTKIDLNRRYPKAVSYIKNTKNEKLKYYDYGTLIIEQKSNLLSQIIKRYVNFMSHKVAILGNEEAWGFIRGIIAGESCVEVNRLDKRYRVYISSTKKEELELYQTCLAKLGIQSKQYQNDKIIISKRENNIKLLEQQLMCLSNEKYNKFLNMMRLYPKISQHTSYFSGKRSPYNKISPEKIKEILDLCYKNPDWSCWKIAKEAGVSAITAARIRKENNLGKRLVKTSKEMVEKVIGFHNKNPSAYAYEIANHLGLHRSRVERIRRNYGLTRARKIKTI